MAQARGVAHLLAGEAQAGPGRIPSTSASAQSLSASASSLSEGGVPAEVVAAGSETPEPLARQAWLFSVDVFDYDTVLSTRDNAGRTQRRLVDLVDVAVALKGGTHGPAAVRWFGLQPGVVAVGIDDAGHQRWLVVRPAGRAEIRVESGGKKETMALRLPALLGELAGQRDEDGQAWLGIGRVMCFQERGDVLKPATVLRACPLPNCYQAGGVCMGNVDQKLFRDLAPLAFFERAFIGSTFTDHAITAPLAGEAGKRRYENILQALRATGGRVPMAMLKEVGMYAKLYA